MSERVFFNGKVAAAAVIAAGLAGFALGKVDIDQHIPMPFVEGESPGGNHSDFDDGLDLPELNPGGYYRGLSDREWTSFYHRGGLFASYLGEQGRLFNVEGVEELSRDEVPMLEDEPREGSGISSGRDIRGIRQVILEGGTVDEETCQDFYVKGVDSDLEDNTLVKGINVGTDYSHPEDLSIEFSEGDDHIYDYPSSIVVCWQPVNESREGDVPRVLIQDAESAQRDAISE